MSDAPAANQAHPRSPQRPADYRTRPRPALTYTAAQLTTGCLTSPAVDQLKTKLADALKS